MHNKHQSEKIMKKLILAASILASSVLAKDIVVDTKKSHVKWEGSKIGDKKHNGTIQIKSSALSFDEKGLAGSFELDMGTIVNLDIADPTWNQKLVGHLSSPDFFDVPKFPTSKLLLKSSSAKEAGLWVVQADLTIKGKTNPVELLVKIEKEIPMVASTSITIDRSKWDVKYGSGSFFKGLGDKLIHDEIKFQILISE
jgi:polyisoprenoid-binding protein YceI